MISAPLPPDETRRLAALRDFQILDTDPEQHFDDITLLASQICGVPIASISLVDEKREWFKSRVGTKETESPRDIAFCAHGILQSETMIVSDAFKDERFFDNPLVTGGSKVRFYAGSPLIASNGQALGMLCVKDQTPRNLAPHQKAALEALSRQVVALLELHRAGIDLRASEEKFRQMAETISDVFWVTSPDLHVIHYVSPGYEKIWGRSTESLYANPMQWVEAILPEDREQVLTAFTRLQTDDAPCSAEYRITRPDGATRWIHDRGFQVKDASGQLIRLTGIASDITERKRIEAKLLQSQKLETVGKLAGGVAHEFNSILTAIIGQSELLLDRIPDGSPLLENAHEIIRAADRAASLTRQLLAYGRKQILQPEILDLDRVIANMEGLFRNFMGRDVQIQIVTTPGPKSVKADAGQLEQVITNIAMNARDAMPNGGKLTLETSAVSFDTETAGQFSDLKPGHYIMLAVTDTGVGMAPDLRARVFEPFFSTKDVGQGAGLGLSTSYGIVKQSGGHITVYSEPGRGATFKIFLPQWNPPDPTQLRGNSQELPRGAETILVVEDDPALRTMAQALLKRLGYTVHTASNGVEALNLKQQRNVGHIDLLFTDVVMPHMSGKELADRVRSLYPHTKILFTSAYAENAIVHQGVLDEGVTLLQKPFKAGALAHKLREVLDNGRPRQEVNST